ncbi:polysaccharide deacetylase family protein [Bacillus litorisediminis]|uniref:polysaccharide deacetylase family protein n=1 Tax=Bacillus litorisediminis TaxID=2922713 RepID=UPI001FAC0E1F|nr:polysaccharide deacetylase family protein [Bacillus litorisediminis]
MKRYVKWLLCLVIAALLIQNPWTSQYVSSLKQDSIPAGKNMELYNEIQDYAQSVYIPPKDAKIDRVWKKTPGLNGLKVDIDASYRNMKKEGKFIENQLVYEQVPPSVHLRDLPAEPIYKGHPEKPMISFLINVAWGEEYLLDILATLKKHNVKATFFLEGRWVQKNPDLAKMIAEGHHDIGNHSYSHPDLKTLSSAKTYDELKKTNEIIEATTGIKPVWFAPPSGAFRKETVEIAHQLNMETIMWSVDSIDWQKPTKEVWLGRVLPKLHNGAMILMHPTASTRDSIETLIIEAKKRGYQIGTVSKLLSEERILSTKEEQRLSDHQ